MPDGDNNINLAALWVPVMAETSGLKAQLARAGAEGGAAFTEAFKSAADVQGAFGGGRSLDLLATRFKKLGDVITGASSGASKGMQAFNTVGVASLVGFAGAMVATTKTAGDFQASQERLVASAGETSKGLTDVSNGILQLAGKVGYSAGQLSDAMYTVEKAGYRGADGVNVLKAAAEGAKSENSDLKEVLGGLTTSMTDFGYGQDKAADVMSKMVAATGMAKTNFQEFSGALHSVEPAAAAAGIKLADIYGSLAQITQSGTSAAQASQNMNRAIISLGKAPQVAGMREEMGMFGISAQDVSQKLGERGLAGTMQLLSNAIRSRMTPAGQVVVDTMYRSKEATDSATKIFDALPPAAKRVAEAIQDGSLSYKEFRKSRGGLDVEQANELNQWVGLQNKITGYSAVLKKGQGDTQTYMQALTAMVGSQDAARIAFQLTGVHADATNQKIKEIDGTTREHDGTVKGFNETQSTLNAKMADAKAAFGAAAIEIGTAFIPVMTSVANVAKDVGDAMSKHPTIMHAAIDAVGALGAAWLAFKGISIVSSITGITTALEGMTAAETAAGGGLMSVLGAAGPLAAGAVAGGVGGHALGNALEHNNWLNQHVRNPIHRFFGVGDEPDKHSGGGSIRGSGTVGKDSVHALLAPGEHVLTAGDVHAMGGQANVYTFRKGLHDAGIRRFGGGGEVGPDVQAAMSMVGTPYSQGARNDCSGMVGRVVEAATGMGGGLPTTKNMGQWLAARGFVSGSGGPGTISVGWYDDGGGPNSGHAAMTLSDGENAESGGSHGNFLIGGSVGASWPRFDHHMYLPNLYGEGQGGGGGGAGGGFGGAGGGGGGGGYFTANPQKVGKAQEEVTHLQQEIKVMEERKSELKSTATKAERDRLDESIRHEHQLLDEANGRLQKAQQGDFHKGRGGSSGGGEGGSTESQAQQFGSGMLTGVMSDLGLGGVLGGKSPLDWGIVKLAGGLASWGLNLANAWADNKGQKMGLPGFGGTPGGGLGGDMGSLGGGMGGESPLAGALGGDSSPAAGLGGGGGGGGIASALGALGGFWGTGKTGPIRRTLPRSGPFAGPPMAGDPRLMNNAGLPFAPMDFPDGSSVAGVPTPAGVDARSIGGAGGIVNNNNQTYITGNSLADAGQLAAPIAEANNAKTYARSTSGSLPAHVGGGGG